MDYLRKNKMKTAKEHILEKSNKGIFASKKTVLALITLANSLLVFFAGLIVIWYKPDSAAFIVTLCSSEIQFIAGVMSATVLGVSVLDYKTVSSLENISKSENIHSVTENITETIDKVLRPRDIDNGSVE